MMTIQVGTNLIVFAKQMHIFNGAAMQEFEIHHDRGGGRNAAVATNLRDNERQHNNSRGRSNKGYNGIS